MSFSFGSSSATPNNATSTAPASGGLFGNASGASTPQFSFGSVGGAPGANAQSTPNASGSPFGQQSGSTTSQMPSGAMFGASTGNAPGTPPAAGGMFGAKSSAAPTTGGMFGTATTSAAGTSGNSSGGGMLGGASSSTTPAMGGGGLFGNASSPATKPASGLFGGGSSSTPSAGGSSGGMFGAQTSSGLGQGNTTATSTNPAAGLFANTGNSLFGNKTGSNTTGLSAPAMTAPAATPSKPHFAAPSTTPAGAPPADSSKAPGANLFVSMSNQPSASGPNPFGGPTNAAPASQSGTTSTGSGLFGGGQSSTPQSGGLFGAKPNSTPAAPSGGLFAANAGGSSSQAQPTQGATSGAGLFGSKPAASTTSTSTAPSSGGLFGSSATPATSAAPGSSTATAASKPGGLFGAGMGSTPGIAAPSAAPTTSGMFGSQAKPSGDNASAQKPASSLFGAASATGTSQPSAISAAPAMSAPDKPAAGAAAGAGGSLFGAKPAMSEADKTKAAEPAKEGTPSAGQDGKGVAMGASTTGPTSQIARLKNKTMEDIVTRWASDLSKYQKEFKEQASVISTWDRKLVENGEKIQQLWLDTHEAERASNEIERQLLSVEHQQNDLERFLDQYEGNVQEIFAKQLGPGEQLAGPDQERERTYKLAEKLSQQLEEKSRDLSKMVNEINEISGALSKGAKPEDPLSQIVRVLNGHLTQLQWIDANASALQAKVAAAQKSSSGLGNHYAGTDNDTAESFYRSYMGRR